MSKRKPLPSQEYLKECFEYDPETVILTWKERPRDHFNSDRIFNSWSARFPNHPVGWTSSNKYGYTTATVKLDRAHYKVHRIIWKLVTGEEPLYIDHIDGNALNNRIDNLRVCDRQTNAVNTCMQSTNKSGINGVCWDSVRKVWIARISDKGKTKHLKTTRDLFEACCARRSAEIHLGYSPRHGKEKSWYHHLQNEHNQ